MITNSTILGTRALQIIPSDYAAIPTPNLQVSGTITDSLSGDTIIEDTSNPFIINPSGNAQYAVNVGDIFYIPNSNVAATIIEVISASQIRINTGIGIIGEDYKIYQESPATGASNTGCFLYIGTEGAGGGLDTLAVMTAGNDYVIFNGITAGAILPVKVKAVYNSNTSCSNIIALW